MKNKRNKEGRKTERQAQLYHGNLFLKEVLCKFVFDQMGMFINIFRQVVRICGVLLSVSQWRINSFYWNIFLCSDDKFQTCGDMAKKVFVLPEKKF